MDFFGLTLGKLIPILLLAALLLGPDQLPKAAERLKAGIQAMRGAAEGAQSRLREEMGPEFDEIDWKRYDPRQYDPRKLVRDAWNGDAERTGSSVTQAATLPPRPQRNGEPAPFDAEAT